MRLQKITPCLWFNTQAEEAANHYISIFKNGKINTTTRYTEEGQDIHGMPPGSVLTVEFELDGQTFTALNGGPAFQFSEAISFQVSCDTQEEIDYYWDKLTDGGEESQCGWLKDKFGVSWQIVPSIMPDLISGDSTQTSRVMKALFPMKKLDIATLQRAHDQE